MAKLTKAELKEAVQHIYSSLVEGTLDVDIAAEMGLEAEEFQALKVAMFDAKADEVRARPTEHTYIQYVIDQSQNVRALTSMIEEFKESRQYNAMVGAVKARSEIHDKLVKFGQEFGLIHREASKSQLLVGHVVADMTNKQLKSAITGELAMLNKLQKRYGGDKGMMDMEPGALHTGPKLLASAMGDERVVDAGAELAVKTRAQKPAKKKKASKTARAKNNKVHGGRSKAR